MEVGGSWSGSVGKSMEVDGSVWKLMEFLEVNGSFWKSTEVDGLMCGSPCTIDGSRWKYIKSV